jgi:hypothetical protein
MVNQLPELLQEIIGDTLYGFAPVELTAVPPQKRQRGFRDESVQFEEMGPPGPQGVLGRGRPEVKCHSPGVLDRVVELSEVVETYVRSGHPPERRNLIITLPTVSEQGVRRCILASPPQLFLHGLERLARPQNVLKDETTG